MTEEKNQEELLLEKRQSYAKEMYADYSKKLSRLGITPETIGASSFTSNFWEPRRLNNVLSDITPDVLASWLKSPKQNESQLRGYSRMLYNVSGEYQGLIDHFVNMARFYYVIDFSGDAEEHAPKTLRKELKVISSELRKMNVAHEMGKVFDTVMKEDVFYGYEISDKKSYFLLKLDPDYCRLSGYADGMWTYEFDLNYFQGTRELLLDTYPEEFSELYYQYLASNQTPEKRWVQLDFDKSVVFKKHESQSEIIPPLATTFEGISELSEYRRYKKINTKLNNYMILHQKVPMFKDTEKTFQQNNFMIDSDSMMMFHAMLDSSLPEEIGAVVSPMDIETIKLEQPHERADRVAEATRDVYNSAGVNQHLFNPDKNSTGGLARSIRKDELIVIGFYAQVARWLNRKILARHPRWKHWGVKLLSTTGQSESEYADFLIKLGTLGFPVTGAISSLLGHDISQVDSMLHLENEVLGLSDKMVPLASTHTGGMRGEGAGRPRTSDDEISDSGQSNRDSNAGVGTGGGD